jgi:hypothetical protein
MIGRLRPGHDPERDAAAYLAGEQPSRVRRRFEAHLMECEDCWEEVRLGRAGRAASEVAREVAPPQLREDVRAAVLMSEARRRLAIGPLAVALVLMVLGSIALGVSLFSKAQPQPIDAALAAFRSGDIPTARAAGRPAPDLSAIGLTLARAGRMDVGTFPVDVFVYRTAGRDQVFVYLSDEAFPEARGAAQRTGAVRGWVAQDDGVAMVCAEAPFSFLLMGSDQRLLDVVEEGLIREVLAPRG